MPPGSASDSSDFFSPSLHNCTQSAPSADIDADERHNRAGSETKVAYHYVSSCSAL